MADDTRPVICIGDERLPARFWSKVHESADGCWHWTGAINQNGYSHYRLAKVESAHRYAFKVLVADPGDLDVDHECHNDDLTCPGGPSCMHRRCVNPSHLRAVSRRVNTLAGRGPSARNNRVTHCPRGHALAGENVRINNSGQRGCVTCERARGRAKQALRRWRKRGGPPKLPPALRTHCPQGHPLSGDNLRIRSSDNARECRACRRESARRRRTNGRHGEPAP